MALQSCKECHKPLSTTAISCPHCGAKPPKGTSIRTWIVGGLFAIIVIKCSTAPDRPLPKAQPTVTQEAITTSPPPEAPKTLAEIANEKKLAALAEKKLIAKRRKEGVTIGMSKSDVLGSSWGKPNKVNTTTTAYATREQWVYNNHQYLYFTNDRLTSAQN